MSTAPHGSVPRQIAAKAEAATVPAIRLRPNSVSSERIADSDAKLLRRGLPTERATAAARTGFAPLRTPTEPIQPQATAVGSALSGEMWPKGPKCIYRRRRIGRSHHTVLGGAPDRAGRTSNGCRRHFANGIHLFALILPSEPNADALLNQRLVERCCPHPGRRRAQASVRVHRRSVVQPGYHWSGN